MIDKYYCTNENEWKKESISDIYSYLFEIKKEKGEQMKSFRYPIKLERHRTAFKLYGRDSQILFSFGKKNDIDVMKNGYEEKISETISES